MRATKRSRARTPSPSLPPLLVLLVAAHLINPVFGLASGAREVFDSLILDPTVSGGYGMLCGQATLLGMWAVFGSTRLIGRLALALSLLTLIAIAPTVLHSEFVTIRYVILPFLGVLPFLPLRWLGLRLRRPIQPGRNARAPVPFTLLELLVGMLSITILLWIAGPKMLPGPLSPTPFDYQVARYSVAYTLLITLVVCTDANRGLLAWLCQSVGLIALAILPNIEMARFADYINSAEVWRNFLAPLHGAQVVVVLVSVSIIRAAGYKFERKPFGRWLLHKFSQVVPPLEPQPWEMHVEVLDPLIADLLEEEQLEIMEEELEIVDSDIEFDENGQPLATDWLAPESLPSTASTTDDEEHLPVFVLADPEQAEPAPHPTGESDPPLTENPPLPDEQETGSRRVRE